MSAVTCRHVQASRPAARMSALDRLPRGWQGRASSSRSSSDVSCILLSIKGESSSAPAAGIRAKGSCWAGFWRTSLSVYILTVGSTFVIQQIHNDSTCRAALFWCILERPAAVCTASIPS